MLLLKVNVIYYPILTIYILEYYSGFNNAVSVFGGIVEKVNGKIKIMNSAIYFI